MAAEGQSPVDRLADLLVFAPLGLIASARTLLPELARRGRQEAAGGQVTVARMVGELAVRQGQRQAGEVLTRVRHQAEAVLDTLIAHSADRDVLSDAPADPQPATSPPAPGADRAAAPSPPAAAPPGPAAGSGVLPTADELAIPGYAALAASQVVPRLAGLTPDELEAVRAYEAATRNRRTVLGRIAQLQAR